MRPFFGLISSLGSKTLPVMIAFLLVRFNYERWSFTRFVFLGGFASLILSGLFGPFSLLIGFKCSFLGEPLLNWFTSWTCAHIHLSLLPPRFVISLRGEVLRIRRAELFMITLISVVDYESDHFPFVLFETFLVSFHHCICFCPPEGSPGRYHF